MVRSINFNNFKKVIAVATVFTIAAFLVPESAQAGAVGASGKSGNLVDFTFNLNLDQPDNNPRDDKGFFPEAIQGFKVVNDPTQKDPTSVLRCGKEVDFCTGSVKVTKLSQIDGKIPGIDLSLSELDQLLSTDAAGRGFDRNLKPNFPNISDDVTLDNVLRYDVTLDSDSEPDLIWFIESNDSNLLLNDLSGLSRFPGALGIFPELARDPKREEREGGVFQISLQSVPEPTSTASLLSIGALGAVSLLKRKKTLKKTHGLNQ